MRAKVITKNAMDKEHVVNDVDFIQYSERHPNQVLLFRMSEHAPSDMNRSRLVAIFNDVDHAILQGKEKDQKAELES